MEKVRPVEFLAQVECVLGFCSLLDESGSRRLTEGGSYETQSGLRVSAKKLIAWTLWEDRQMRHLPYQIHGENGYAMFTTTDELDGSTKRYILFRRGSIMCFASL